MSVKIVQNESYLLSENLELFDSVRRVPISVNALNDTYTENQVMSYELPNECLDLRESFIECSLTKSSVTAQVNESVNFSTIDPATGQLAVVVSGSFAIKCGGSVTPQYIIGVSTAAEMEANLACLPPLRQRGYLVSEITCSDGLLAGGVFSVVMANPSAKMFQDYLSLEIVDSSALVSGTPDVYASWTAAVVAGALEAPRCQFGSASLVSRVDVRLGSETIATCSQFNVLGNLLMMSESNDSVSKGLRSTELAGSNPASRAWAAASGSKRIVIRLRGLQAANIVWPLQAIKQALRIDITLSPNATAMIQSSTGVGGYILSQPKIYLHQLQLPDDINQSLIARAQGPTGVTLPFKSYQHYSSVIAAGSTSKTVLANFSYKRFLGLFCTLRSTTVLNDPIADYKSSRYYSNSIQFARLRLGSQFYPRDALRSINESDVCSFAESYRQMLPTTSPNAWVGSDDRFILSGFDVLDSDVIAALDGEQLWSRFVIAVSCDPHARDISSRRLSQGVDISSANACTLELTGMSALAAENAVDLFGCYQAAITLRNGQAILSM